MERSRPRDGPDVEINRDLKIFYCLFIFERERERDRPRDSLSGGGAEREGDTESEAGSKFSAIRTKPT